MARCKLARTKQVPDEAGGGLGWPGMALGWPPMAWHGLRWPGMVNRRPRDAHFVVPPLASFTQTSRAAPASVVRDAVPPFPFASLAGGQASQAKVRGQVEASPHGEHAPHSQPWSHSSSSPLATLNIVATSLLARVGHTRLRTALFSAALVLLTRVAAAVAKKVASLIGRDRGTWHPPPQHKGVCTRREYEPRRSEQWLHAAVSSSCAQTLEGHSDDTLRVGGLADQCVVRCTGAQQ
ncbi:hypothetical protein DCS_02471 [Drechmeria coniospora]|uniref:Uncharacterized protein n=1 Tax=Drechmeria coniospora TaxID=98403 RepID=A0A151GW50_DRECN|nr:hypothetical protein DCS_02471 [Drechmeria coniospora]KYK61329.1 hypothetical protein DCS_02471 [Drechmeria coniospora]